MTKNVQKFAVCQMCQIPLEYGDTSAFGESELSSIEGSIEFMGNVSRHNEDSDAHLERCFVCGYDEFCVYYSDSTTTE